jgi:uncharacterized protein
MKTAVTGLVLGPPGVYRATVPAVVGLQAIRMDVAGFVGVAPRGPVDIPIAVDSWSDFQWQFGEEPGSARSPGLLGEAVRVFFAQGGRRAWVLRVSPLPRLPSREALEAHAALSLTWGSVEVRLRARSEGTWGTRLVAQVDFVARDRFTSEAVEQQIPLPDGARCASGDLLRITGSAVHPPPELRWAEEIVIRDDTRVALLDRAPAQSAPLRVDVITASVTVTDTSRDLPRQERITDLGLRAHHTRFVGKVLEEESRLVIPDGVWPEEMPPAGTDLPGITSSLVMGTGADRWAAISGESFGDPSTDPSLLPIDGPDGLDGLEVHGLDRLSLEQEIMLLSAPDLLWDTVVEESPVSLDATAAVTVRNGQCSADPVVLELKQPPLGVVYLDGRTQLDEVVARQSRFVALAERQRRFVALLDVPQRLSLGRSARWRATFNSSYAAAYHPWLGVVDSSSAKLRAIHVPPSAYAAGIIAARERAVGIPWGPANIVAEEAVTAAEGLGLNEAEELDALDINLFRPERDGFRLVAARTLATDPDFHQLSVRRLMTMLRLVLERQTQWLAFEPHTDELRRQITDAITQLLRDLFRVGAFAGDTEEESFFVRCDETVNPAWSVDQGRLVAEVGVAPSVPLEFIILRLSRDVGGSFAVEV